MQKIQQNSTLLLIIAFKMAYSCCFSLGGNLNFLFFLRKSFITLTTVLKFGFAHLECTLKTAKQDNERKNAIAISDKRWLHSNSTYTLLLLLLLRIHILSVCSFIFVLQRPSTHCAHFNSFVPEFIRRGGASSLGRGLDTELYDFKLRHTT